MGARTARTGYQQIIETYVVLPSWVPRKGSSSGSQTSSSSPLRLFWLGGRNRNGSTFTKSLQSHPPLGGQCQEDRIDNPLPNWKATHLYKSQLRLPIRQRVPRTTTPIQLYKMPEGIGSTLHDERGLRASTPQAQTGRQHIYIMSEQKAYRACCTTSEGLEPLRLELKYRA